MAEESKVYIVMEGNGREIFEIKNKTFNSYKAAEDYVIKDLPNKSWCCDNDWVQIATIDENQVAQMESNVDQFIKELENTGNFHSVMYCNIGNVFLDVILYEDYMLDTLEDFQGMVEYKVSDLCSEDADKWLEIGPDDFDNDTWERLFEKFNDAIEQYGNQEVSLEDAEIWEEKEIKVKVDQSIINDLGAFIEANKNFFDTESNVQVAWSNDLYINWKSARIKNPFTNIKFWNFDGTVRETYDGKDEEFFADYYTKMERCLKEFMKAYNIQNMKAGFAFEYIVRCTNLFNENDSAGVCALINRKVFKSRKFEADK